MSRDMSYLADRPIAVLGGDAVGKTVAADCKLAGREVRLYSRSPRSIENLDRTGILLDGIQRNLYAFERSGRAHLDLYTTDMAEAVHGVGIIVIAITALSQMDYLTKLVPLLEDGQVIHTFTDNYTSLVIRKLMRKMGIGGTSSWAGSHLHPTGRAWRRPRASGFRTWGSSTAPSPCAGRACQ